jgi:hypothetical protein
MGPWQVAGQPATQTNAIGQPCPRNYWFSAEKLKSGGFASAFSYLSKGMKNKLSIFRRPSKAQ